MLNGSMAYIDATLSNAHDSHQLHIDADDMKELMDNAYHVVSNTLYRIGKFNITSFNSNVMSLDHFNTLMEMRLQKK
ncbi:hypothetical protein [Sulfuricurvum sp.]|uniref:hypothetical protein n=1 Tax=Sulfuricurvum sp. TaxID=2025608 RepID=UPI002E35DD80|nr:hypothetical protein [Sulfuricurvum sp.]HEX5330344.1 hypothetical protein [Sulfuricurvum sp.]